MRAEGLCSAGTVTGVLGGPPGSWGQPGPSFRTNNAFFSNINVWITFAKS